MNLNRLLLVLCVAILFVSCKKETATNNSNPVDSSSTIVYNVNKTSMLQLINQQRAKGCTCGTTVMPAVAPITWNDLLGKAAYDHSADMKTNNYFAHNSQDGTTPGTRITAAGYTWSTWGENIAEGYTDEQSVMTAWINSPGHCMNIMNGNFKEIGFGRSGNYWTQDFGAK